MMLSIMLETEIRSQNIEMSYHDDHNENHTGTDFAQMCANAPFLLCGSDDATMRLP